MLVLCIVYGLANFKREEDQGKHLIVRLFASSSGMGRRRMRLRELRARGGWVR